MFQSLSHIVLVNINAHPYLYRVHFGEYNFRNILCMLDKRRLGTSKQPGECVHHRLAQVSIMLIKLKGIHISINKRPKRQPWADAVTVVYLKMACF